MRISVDASGDIGLKRGPIVSKTSSSYYCLGVIAYKDGSEKAENLINTVRNEYYAKHKQKLPDEIKWLKLKKDARLLFCQKLAKSDMQMYVLSLNKLNKTVGVADWIGAKISENKILKELLVLLFENIFFNTDYKLELEEKIDMFFDEGIHQNYSRVLERQVRRYNYKVTIQKPQDSKKNPSVQLADLIAGAFHHYLKGDGGAFRILKDKCKLSELCLEKDKGTFKLTHSKIMPK